MSAPDWLLVALGLVGLALAFAIAGHWLAVYLIAGFAAGLALGVWA